MTIGEFITAVVLSAAAVWIWSQVAGFFLTAAFAAARAFWRTRIEQREEIERAVERVKAECQAKREAAKASSPPEHPNCRCSTVPIRGVSPLQQAAQAIDRLDDPSPIPLPAALSNCPCDFCVARRRLEAAMSESPAPLSARYGWSPRAGFHELGNEANGRRKQLVERLALDVGEAVPVFCSWPAGHQEIRIPTRGGDPLVLRRTEECVLDDSTGRLAVVYRLKPE